MHKISEHRAMFFVILKGISYVIVFFLQTVYVIGTMSEINNNSAFYLYM